MACNIKILLADKVADKMGITLQLDIESGLLRVVVRGEFSLSEAKRTFLEVLDAVAQHKTGKVLFDGRELRGKPKSIERFYYGEFAAQETRRLITEHRVFRAPWFAYVLRKPVLDPHKFGETVAVNRGMIVKVFENLEDALKWLEPRQANKPDAGDD